MILKKIKIKEPFTLITLAKEFGVSEKTIERDINELKDDGIIRFVGSKRTGRYEIIFGIKH
jgi:DeoR/GlpR family transcriptional regulator of sugar metabolism